VEARSPALWAENWLTPCGWRATFISTSWLSCTTARNATRGVVPAGFLPLEGVRTDPASSRVSCLGGEPHAHYPFGTWKDRCAGLPACIAKPKLLDDNYPRP
jgi:hypothetical protein